MASPKAEQERRRALGFLESRELVERGRKDKLASLKRGGSHAELDARRQMLNCDSETCYRAPCNGCVDGVIRRSLFPDLTAALWDIDERARKYGQALALITVIDRSWTRPRGRAHEINPPMVLRRVGEVLKSADVNVGFIAFELSWNRWRNQLFRSCWQGHAHGVVLVPQRWQVLRNALAQRFEEGPSGADTVRFKDVYDLAGAVTYSLKLETTDAERFDTWRGLDVTDHQPQPWMRREHACALSPFKVGELVMLLGLQRRGARVELIHPVDDWR